MNQNAITRIIVYYKGCFFSVFHEGGWTTFPGDFSGDGTELSRFLKIGIFAFSNGTTFEATVFCENRYKIVRFVSSGWF